MKHQKMIGTVLIVCVFLLSLTGCTPGFEGNSVKNADSYALDIEVMTGTVIYQGDGTEATKFTLNVPEDGVYTISVEGKKAQGSICVDVEKAPGCQHKGHLLPRRTERKLDGRREKYVKKS